ncbi:MAG: hypothetical protein ACPGTP_08285, partial [Bacteroidia bacterium]
MKNIHLLIAVILLSLISSCKTYRQVSFTPEELYARSNFATNYDQFVYIVHKQDSAYKVADPLLKNGVISGKRTATEKYDPKETSRKERKSEIHLYPHADSELARPMRDSDSTVKLYKEDIQSVQMFAKKRGG